MREDLKQTLVESFKNKHVVVVGDTIVDKTTYSKAVGLSLESPTLKAKFDRETVTYGGAANIVRHLHAFGINTSFVTTVVDSAVGILESLQGLQGSVYNIEHPDGGNEKHRFYVSHGTETYKHFQLNRTCEQPAYEWNMTKVVHKLMEDLKSTSVDVVVFSDYNCHLITPSLRDRIINLARSKNAVVFAAAQSTNGKNNLLDYKDADVVVANREEMKQMTAAAASVDGSTIKWQYLYETDGDKGSKLFRRGTVEPLAKNLTAVPANNVKNTIGAGDAFLAAVVAGRGVGTLANEFANDWAALTIQKELGVVPSLSEWMESNG